MRKVLVDTSALYAALDGNDLHHSKAKSIFQNLLAENAELWAHSFILLETLALLQNRVGLSAVAAFRTGLQDLLKIFWVDAPTYEEALQKLIRAGRLKVSLVDSTSFVFMKNHAIREAFAFDPDFEKAGYRLIQP